MDIETLIVFLSCFALFIVWNLFEHFKKFSLSKDMFEKIAWIVEKKSNMWCNNVHLRNEDLITYFYEEQIKLYIPENLRLDYSNEIEKADAEKILEAHRNHVINLYFSDTLIKDKNKYKLSSFEYYMFSLFNFLQPEINEHRDYNKDKIYSFKSLDKPYSYYTLTNYGRAYYKLYLITLMFIEKNENTNDLYKYIDSKHKNNIMENLKKNEVSFVSLR